MSSTQNVNFVSPTTIALLQAQITALQTSAGSQGPSISFLLNGKKITVQNPDPSLSLGNYIRYFTPFTATKIGCNQGGCGVCTVMLSYRDPADGILKNVPVNSCLVKLVQVNNLAVTTNDGIGNAVNPHPIQIAFSKIGAFQCGFCTSGQIMSIYSAFQTTNGQSTNGQTPSWEQVEKNLDGNLCRCTGYRPIIEAYKAMMVSGPTGAAPYVDPSNAYQMEQYNAIWNKWLNPSTVNTGALCRVYNPANDTLNAYNYLAQNPTMLSLPTSNAVFTSPQGWKYWYTPSLTGVSQALVSIGTSNYSTVSVNQGLTSWGVPHYGPYDSAQSGKTNVLDVSAVPELNSIVVNGDGSIKVGAGIKYTKLSQYLSAQSSQVLQFIGSWINNISGYQVRNRGAWIGGTCMAKQQSFQSDMTLMMLTVGVTLQVRVFATNGTSTDLSLTTLQFLNYNFGSSVWVVISGTFPAFTTSQKLFGYRVAKRLYQAHNLGEMAALVNYTDSGKTSIVTSTIWVGGLGATTNAGYQEWTSGETYLSAKAVSAVDPVALVNVARGTSWSITPEYIPQYSSTGSEIAYFQEIMNGHALQLVNDIKNAGDNMRLTKTTAWGSQQYGSPSGTFNDIYNYVLPQQSTGTTVGRYKPRDITKATGQVEFSADIQSKNPVFVVAVNANGNNIPFDGSKPVPRACIDFNSSVTQAAITRVKAMPGVQLVLMYPDMKPNESFPNMYIERYLYPLTVAYGLGTNPAAGGSTTDLLQNDNNSNSFDGFQRYVYYIGQAIGCIAAETYEEALAASVYLGKNVAYVTPIVPVSPITMIATSGALNNVMHNSVNSNQFFGSGNDYTTNFDGTPIKATTGAIDFYSTGAPASLISDFDTVYPSWTGAKINGQYYWTTTDHSPMERNNCTVVPIQDGRYRINYATQFTTAFNGLASNYTFGAYTGADGILYYSPSGPARFANGSLVWDETNFDLVIPHVGGGFGSKLFIVYPAWYTYVCARLLRRAAVYQEPYDSAMNNLGGGGGHGVNYQLAFNNLGKVIAFSNDHSWDSGLIPGNLSSDLNITHWANANGLGLNDTCRSFGSLFNWGAFKNYSLPIVTNKAPGSARRSFGQSEGNFMGNSALFKVSSYLNNSQFDVMVTNLVTPDSPFVDYNGTPIFSTGRTIQQDKYVSNNELSFVQLLQALDRKVNQVYYQTGSITWLYPNGYTGSALATPTTGSAYNDTTARYPAIKQLEADIATWNARPANKYQKVGMSVAPHSYIRATWNSNTKLQVQLRNNEITVDMGLCDAGTSSKERILETIANELGIDVSLIRWTKNANENAFYYAGLVHAGSSTSITAVIAAQDACVKFINAMFDAMYEDLTYNLPSILFGNVNCFPANGSSYPYAPTGSASPADVAYAKTLPRDIQLLVLNRYARQDPTYVFPSGVNATREEITSELTSVFTKLSGILGSAPGGSTLIPGVLPRLETATNSAWFSANRRIIAQGSNYNTTFNGPAGAIHDTRCPCVVLSIFQVNFVDGARQGLHSIIVDDMGLPTDPLGDMMQIEGGEWYGKTYVYESNDFEQSTGKRLNPDTWEYKPPCSRDTPARVDTVILNNPASIQDPLTSGLPNTTKPVGEIATPGGTSAAAMAIYDAMHAYRRDTLGLSNTDVSWVDTICNRLVPEEIKKLCPLPTNPTL